MQPVYLAALRSWSIPPAATFVIVLSACVYLRGWWLLRRVGVPFLPPWRAAAFLLGLFSLWIALASPMDVFNGFVLTAHMLQHMLLMMVAPPLILLGAPLIPMVRGLPIFAAREYAGPFLNWSVAKQIGRALTNPIVASLLMGVAMFAWHTPRLYELALRSSSWHQVEHTCFLLASLIFWWPVVQPWPSRAQWPRWAMVPYLLVADLQNTVLSAILTFSDRVLYPSYSAAPRLFGFSALEDQVAAGAIMWVVGSLAFVIPAIVIAVQCLSRSPSRKGVSSFRGRERLLVNKTLATWLRIPFGRSSLLARFTSRAFEAISFAVLFVALGSCLVWLLTSASDDSDDQALRFRQETGPFAVAVFAAPGDLLAGPIDFAILVQDRNTREVLLDTKVDLTAAIGDTRMKSSTVSATYQDSQNKLLQSAAINLPTVGNWSLDISVRRGLEQADLSLPLQVTSPDAGNENRWPYVAIPVVFAIFLLVYMWRHRFPRRTALNTRSHGNQRHYLDQSYSPHNET